MLGDTLRRRNAAPASPPKRPPGPRRRRPASGLARWLLAAVVILLGSFGTGYLLSTQVLFPAPDTVGTGIPVPDLYGSDREGAEGTLVEAGLAVGRVLSQASMDAPEGQVIAQSPLAGQQLRPGASVDVVLSAGPPRLSVAPLAGLDENVARDLLEQTGFAVELAQVPAQAAAGVVTGTDPAAGTQVSLPATVTLFVSSGPPRVDTSLVDPVLPGGTP